MDLDKFIKFAKEEYDLDIIKVADGKGLTFKDIFGVDFIKDIEKSISIPIKSSVESEK